MVTELSGEIAANGEQGLFASDTRFVSYYAISANGEPWTRITSSTPIYYGVPFRQKHHQLRCSVLLLKNLD
jgi:hypothetical protein